MAWQRLQNDLLYVEWDAKLHLFTHLHKDVAAEWRGIMGVDPVRVRTSIPSQYIGCEGPLWLGPSQ